MNYRLATLLDRETADTATTKVIDVSLSEMISAFSIQFRGYNSSDTPTAHPAKMISKIELVDGSDVLCSLSGMELQAINISEMGKPLYAELQYINHCYAIIALELRFGRHLWDEQLALDPTRFKNLQLKITHNKASGGSAPSAGQLSVLAHVFDEKVINPVGFLVNREVFSYTLVASAHKYIDLPVDRPIRKIGIKALYTALQPWENVNKVKLYTDEQKKVIINDVRLSDLLRCYANSVNPYFNETIRLYNDTTAVTSYCTSAFDTKMVFATFRGTDSAWLGLESYGGTFTQDLSAAEAGDLIVYGKSPHGMFFMPMGVQEEIEDWFNAPGVGSAKLDLTAGGSANGDVEITVQQLRKY